LGSLQRSSPSRSGSIRRVKCSRISSTDATHSSAGPASRAIPRNIDRPILTPAVTPGDTEDTEARQKCANSLASRSFQRRRHLSAVARRAKEDQTPGRRSLGVGDINLSACSPETAEILLIRRLLAFPPEGATNSAVQFTKAGKPPASRKRPSQTCSLRHARSIKL
jgi:hypothetical protein